MMITPVEITLAAINIAVLLLIIGFYWQLQKNQKSVCATADSIKGLSKRMEDLLTPSEEGSKENSQGGSASGFDQEKIKEYFSTLANGLQDHHKQTGKALEQINKYNFRLEGMLGGIRDFLSSKNNLTVRLQEGYDFQILNNFSRQIIQCIHQIESSMSKQTKEESIKNANILRNDLLDLLDRNGIERFSPEPGTAFSSIRKIAEVLPQKVETADEKLCGKVADVTRPGYRYVFNDSQHRILMPAQVKVYEKKRD